MSDDLKPAVQTGFNITHSRLDRPVVALGYQAPDGTITVTDVLCMNFPSMTNQEVAALSYKLDQWSRMIRR